MDTVHYQIAQTLCKEQVRLLIYLKYMDNPISILQLSNHLFLSLLIIYLYMIVYNYNIIKLESKFMIVV